MTGSFAIAGFALLGLFIALAIGGQISNKRMLARAQKRGLLPLGGQGPNLEHVRNAALAGEKILAIKLYRQIHENVGLAEAKDAVEHLTAEMGR